MPHKPPPIKIRLNTLFAIVSQFTPATDTATATAPGDGTSSYLFLLCIAYAFISFY